MKYTNYRQITNKFMNNVERHLKETYGEVKSEWETTLFLLAENLDMYLECKDAINENGIFDSSSFRKNPLLSTIKDLQATIMKQVQHLGISPYSASKIRMEAEEDNEDFIEALTK